MVDTGVQSNGERVVAAIQQLQQQLEIRRRRRNVLLPRETFRLCTSDYRNAPPKPIRYVANTTMPRITSA